MKRLAILLLVAVPLRAVASPATEVDAAVEARYSAEHGRCIDAAAGRDFPVIDCDQRELEKQDQALNRIYRALLRRLPKRQAAQLRTSQRMWLRNGQEHCVGEVGLPFQQWGTLERVIYSGCYLERTIRRTVSLERYGAGRASLRDIDR